MSLFWVSLIQIRFKKVDRSEKFWRKGKKECYLYPPPDTPPPL